MDRNKRLPVKPNVSDVLPIVTSLFSKNMTGCCWHAVLDDANTKQSSVMWVINEWLPKRNCGNIECQQLAKLLPLMSTTQRNKLVHSIWRKM